MIKQIVDILEKDAKVSIKEIAQRLGSSESEIKERIEYLEKEKILLGYRAVINRNKLESSNVMAVIEVRVSPERDGGFDRIAKRIYEFPEVKSMYLVSGSFDFLIFIEGESLKDVASFVSTKLATLERVHHTATHFMLKTYKENGVFMEEENNVERLSITP